MRSMYNRIRSRFRRGGGRVGRDGRICDTGGCESKGEDGNERKSLHVEVFLLQ